ncbi:hypothetical protein GCM10010145_00260 [Streptomyces ruber]|uniref:DUF2993 domain-containing protein n=2 Tax=Streptomyces TaxID=1883 RepID=A0A918B6J9_9ACTN|nr:DUF2993 domain-containing protein [Streptomyces ruber]GGQ37240.1 hypothetical protein GCM10010145_00260 [Streptomyces ruber]
MRALRTLIIVVVVLGGLFVIADRVAVNFAENEAADRLRANEGLASTPDVSIKGFPFLTQVVGGELDDVEVGIPDYEASSGDGGDTVRITGLKADMRGVVFSGDFSSATARSATGSATIPYDELLKAAQSEPTEIAPGVTARVVGLSDGGNGKIKIELDGTVLGVDLPRPVSVLSSVAVEDGTVRLRADSLPNLGADLGEESVRSLTDFQQAIDQLPGGIQLDKVEGAADGVRITVKGSDVKLAG